MQSETMSQRNNQQKLDTQDRHYHVRCGTIFKDCDLD